jgi:hypothetical protein
VEVGQSILKWYGYIYKKTFVVSVLKKSGHYSLAQIHIFFNLFKNNLWFFFDSNNIFFNLLIIIIIIIIIIIFFFTL